MTGAAQQHQVETGRHRHRAHDPTFYPTEEKVGQDTLQMRILEILRPLLERWYELSGKPTFVGEDQFIYYERFHPEKVVAPDLYVLPGVKPGRRIKSWKVWKTGVVPTFALEVVSSSDPAKDYHDVIARYGELGVSELIVFDPDHDGADDRVRWQRYRRLQRRGFVQVESSNADRIRSRVLGCFLRVVGDGDDARLRLGTGPAGDDLVPTEAEGHEALRGRRVLVIDDDARNVFAITSTLELYGMTVTQAPNGRKGVEALLSADDTDLILMDVMMPEMDGYTTMNTIRQMPSFAALPIIAVTARAMPGDREKSIAADRWSVPFVNVISLEPLEFTDG